MFFVKLKVIVAFLLFLGLTANSAVAQGNDKFAKMDKDNSNSISWDEFKGQYPQMKKLAFDSIDTNRDDSISTEEWGIFQDSHKMDQSSSPKEMKQMKGNMQKDDKPAVFMHTPPK